MAGKGRGNKPVADPELFGSLMDAFSFTADDLETNRDGLISDAQVHRLRGMGKSLTDYSRFSIKFMTAFVVIAGGLIVLMFGFNDSMRKAALGDTSGMMILAVALPIPIVLVIAYSFVTRKQRSQYEHARLMSAEGRAEITKKVSSNRTGTDPYWELKVGNGFRLNLLEEYAALFKQNTIYRVYYAQVGRAPTILSIEESG